MCELGEALRTSGAFAQAEVVLTAARAEAGATGERRLELRAELALLNVKLSVDPEARADELLDRATAAIPVLEELGDDRALGRAWFYVAYINGPYHAHYAQAEEAAGNALRHYERAGWPFAACLAARASALLNGPATVVQAIAACEELRAAGDLNGEANILPFLGALHAMSGDFEQARECVRRSREIFVELGQALAAEYSCGSVQSEIETLAGDLGAAQAALESSYAILEQHGERSYLATRTAAP
jgi:hypothetical protein